MGSTLEFSDLHCLLGARLRLIPESQEQCWREGALEEQSIVVELLDVLLEGVLCHAC